MKLLQATYNLNDDMTRILIGSRLKDKAFDWFHSKAENVEIPISDLFSNLKTMFGHRLDRITRRQRFEERIWKKGEIFSDYLHDKIILANRVSIDNTEIIDYIIEGISDPSLRDQARIQRFDSTAALLQAFEKITIRPRGRFGEERADTRAVAGESGERRTRRCYNCGQSGHVSIGCPMKDKGVKCFRCGTYGHVVAKCANNRGVAPEANTVRNCNDNVQSRGKWFKSVEIAKCSIDALIDSGSDLCLMRASRYIKIEHLHCVEAQFHFTVLD